MLEADLQALQALHDWMRSVGATTAKLGEYELCLGAPVVAQSHIAPEADETPEARLVREEEDHYRTLLYSSGSSPEQFIAAARKQRQG